jgi:hypothetical protein
MQSSFARPTVSTLWAALVWTLICVLLATSVSLAAQDEHSKPEHRSLSWHPPKIDAKLKSFLSEPACDLPDVLRKAGDGAYTLYSSLNSFTAREDIQFLNLQGNSKPYTFAYDYQVFYKLVEGESLLRMAESFCMDFRQSWASNGKLDCRGRH